MKAIWMLTILIIATLAEDNNPCIGNVGVRRFPDPTDCTRFFLCIGEDSFPSQCGVHLIFDVITENCNEESVSVCIKDIATPPTPSVPGDTTATTDDGITGVPEAPTPEAPTTLVPEAPTPEAPTPEAPTPEAPTPEPSTPAPQTTTLAPPVVEPHCPLDQVFYAPHPDCSKFFRCVFGTLFVLECPPNQHWNQAQGFCDHPFNVQCPSG
ncbi:fibronectin-binding protein A-like [Wyeomyia smithii]|uniref:fibronectin-binding protein A-like n=1 Tax=Wyeomyia smithii TaxID=174621 RepID=UPI00246815D8|nr:fibronectin-binding protein A-like [Wyeomyia smithii]